MTKKRFTDIEHDYENARIKCKDNGMFMLYAIYENDEGLPTLGDLLNEQEKTIQEYKHLIKIATSLIEWNTIPQVRRQWEKHLSKVGDDGMTTKDCFHCYYAQSNEDGLHCYRKTRTKVKGTDTCEHYKK